MKLAKKMFFNIEEIVSSVFFTIMCISVALGVFARFFELSLVWTDELARYTFIWSVLLGTVVAYKHKKHIVIDALSSLLPKKVNAIIQIIVRLGLLYLFFILLKYGWGLTIQTWGVPTTSLEIPTGFVYLVVPLASFLLIVYTLIELYQIIIKKISNPT
ncbi:TRAP transporter small permease [Metabacillus niabensis]|uniref:TRAP transporter small permease n=1 Tax=Metabacillus niabensis TaxID=324854 RepID=UPI001CFBD419|nr:TRAP transporter small permease [Metabacillus niabensis]